MRQTNRRHDLVALHIQDAREKSLPDVGVLAIEDAETGEVVELDTADPEVRARFEQEVERPHSTARARFSRRGHRHSGTGHRGSRICRHCNGFSKTGNADTDETHIHIHPAARTGLDARSSLAADQRDVGHAGHICRRRQCARHRGRAPSSVPQAVRATPPGAVTDDIRDIRGPKHIPSPWLWPLWLAGGAALAALLLRRPGAGIAGARSSPCCSRMRSRSPGSRKPASLMQPEHAREFSIAVSEIVRQLHRGAFPGPGRAPDHRRVPARSARSVRRAAHRAIVNCWRIFSSTATSPNSPAGFSRSRRWKPCSHSAHDLRARNRRGRWHPMRHAQPRIPPSHACPLRSTPSMHT